MNSKNVVKARAPAKLILSGEHAVVYGQPALAMAINRYTESRLDWSTPFHFNFNLPGIDFRQKMTLEVLKRVKRKLEKQYHQFSLGNISIREVIKHPVELSLYTAISMIEKLKHKLPMGIDIDTESTIPSGCGLGSSAACVVSMMTALGRFLNIDMTIEDYLRLGIESENLQHGFSSGLDVHVSYHGGCILYENGLFNLRPMPDFPLQLVLTGKPTSSTGECVSHAKSFFAKGQLLQDFKAVTLALDQAVQANDIAQIRQYIRHNHQLLRQIEVVPSPVVEFVDLIEKNGGAAKICGAGSIREGAAGVVLVVSDHDIKPLCDKFCYELLDVAGEPDGAILL